MKLRMAILAATIGCLIAPATFATEIITKRELKDGVLRTEQLVKVADNGIFLLDTSSSTREIYPPSGKSIVQTMKSELVDRNGWFPDLGHEIGIYTYTDWQDNYPVALYDRDKVGAALAGVRDKGAGPTPLRNGLRKLDAILDGLTGRSAVFLFWDGEFTGPDPVKDALEIAKKNDVCYYVVSSAKPKREAELAHNVATINNCSRVIPLADFFAHPEYTSAALWDVKVTEHPVPTNELNFTFNGIELGADDEAHLDKIAAFMAEHKDVHLVAAGYTDDVGSRDYNEGLSKKRAEMVGNYLKSKGVEESRMVLLWYGLTNPIVPNDSDENRAKNRRVEIKLSLAE
jgi:outer membrane protein OmpA-like peptidoglycan-associated protein